MNYSIHSLIKAGVLKACVTDPFVNSTGQIMVLGTQTYHQVLSKFLVGTIASNPHGHTLRHRLQTSLKQKGPTSCPGSHRLARRQSWHSNPSFCLSWATTDWPAPLHSPASAGWDEDTALWSWVGTLQPYEGLEIRTETIEPTVLRWRTSLWT